MGADGDIDAVVLAAQILKPDVRADVHLGVDGDAQGEDGADLPVQQLPGEAVAGDAVAQHTPQLAALLVHVHLMAHERQVVGGGESAGAAADNGHPLAGGGGAQGLGHIPRRIHRVALEGPDVHGVIDHVPAAAGLAGVLADVGAGHREGIVLADEADGVLAAAGAYERNIAGDVDAGGTQRHAGHGVLQIAQAAVVVDVLPVVVREAVNSVQHQLGRVPPDGAGGGGGDGLGGLLNNLHVPGLGPSVQHIPQQG